MSSSTRYFRGFTAVNYYVDFKKWNLQKNVNSIKNAELQIRDTNCFSAGMKRKTAEPLQSPGTLLYYYFKCLSYAHALQWTISVVEGITGLNWVILKNRFDLWYQSAGTTSCHLNKMTTNMYARGEGE